MPAALKQYAALKWIGVFPNNWQVDNPQKIGTGLPTALGSLILNDRHTGYPLMVMDCASLTAYRTAATSAIVAKHCAPNNVTRIAFIGCGKQAYYHAIAYKAIFGDFTACLYDKDDTAAVKLTTKLARHGLHSYKISKEIKDITKDADIITTLTPSRTPYLDIHDIKSNCHINAVGADAVGKRELKTNVIDGATNIFCDDSLQAFHSGELQHSHWPNLEVGSMYDLIKKNKSIDPNKGVSVFDSTGVAIEDIAVGILVYDLNKDERL